MAIEQRFDCRREALRRGIVAQVERVAGADEIRQRVAQCRRALIAQRGQLAVASEQFVQRHRRRRRPVADDHQPLAAQRMHMAEGFHRREQLMGILHAQQAGALDGGVIGGIQPQLAVEQQLLRRWLRPLLITRMGLLREALREAEKRRASLMFSRYSKMALVLLSRAKKSSRSSTSMSVLSPSAIK